MSTRATIRFRDKYDTFFVYRHSDGHPDNVLNDIQGAIEKAKGRWSGSECGLLVSFFLGTYFKAEERLPQYMMTSEFHGDESYRYFVEWNSDEKKWVARVNSPAEF